MMTPAITTSTPLTSLNLHLRWVFIFDKSPSPASLHLWWILDRKAERDGRGLHQSSSGRELRRCRSRWQFRRSPDGRERHQRRSGRQFHRRHSDVDESFSVALTWCFFSKNVPKKTYTRWNNCEVFVDSWFIPTNEE